MDARAASLVHRSFARDERGRILFLPWYPFSRNAYVLPDPARQAVLARRMELYVAFWLGVLLGWLAARLLGGSSPGAPLLFAAIVLAHWAWWAHRSTRGLERVRHEAG